MADQISDRTSATIVSPLSGSYPAIYALYAPNRYLAAKTRVLIDFLVARFGDEPDWDRFARG